MISANVQALLGEWDIFELLLNILIYQLAENISQKILKILRSTNIIWSTILSIYSMTTEYNTTFFQTIFIFQIEIREEKMN